MTPTACGACHGVVAPHKGGCARVLEIRRRARALSYLALLAISACGTADSANDQPVPGGVITTPIQPVPHSGQLLTRLEPQDTGIVHQNDLPLERIGNYIHVGGGVAAGDYDGDGWTDLFLVSQTGTSKLFRNLGNWRFEDVTAESGIAIDRAQNTGRWDQRFPTGAQFVDADGDGDLDLYVTAFAGAASYFENRGGGKFRDATEKAGLGYVGASTTPAFGDFDRDGDLDLYLATYRPYSLDRLYPPGIEPPDPILAYDLDANDRLLSELDVLYRNDGTGRFEDVTVQYGLQQRGWGLAARFAHLNDDLWGDLYVANDFETPDLLLVNDRAGRLVPLANDAYGQTPYFSMGMDVADINNDGLMDIFASDMLSPSRLHRQTQTLQGVLPENFSAPTGAAPQVMRNTLLLNEGNGTFSDIAPFAGVTASDWTWTVKFVDLDLDSLTDVLVTNGFVYDAMNADEGLRHTNLKQAGRTQEVLDLLRSRPPLLTPNIIYRNKGDLTFENVAATWGFDDTAIANGAALADLDNDGDLDVVVNNMNAPVGVYRSNADANRIKVSLVGEASNTQGIGSRLTLETIKGIQVQEMSMSGGYLSGHEAVVVFGLGDLAGASRLTVEWPSGHVSEITDLVANSSLVIAEPAGPGVIVEPAPAAPPQFEAVAAADSGVAFEHEESEFDDYVAQPLLPEKMSKFGPGVAWGIDGDAPVLAIAGGLGQPAGVFEYGEDGGFSSLEGRTAPDGYEPQAMLWWPDGTLLASLSSIETEGPGPHPSVAVLRGELDVSDVSVPSSAGPLAAADYDGDGLVDLFVGGRVVPGRWPEPASSGLFRGTGSALMDVTDAIAPQLAAIGMVTGAVWSDADGDGDVDLLLARDMAPPALFRNDGGILVDATAEAGFAGYSGRWTGVATGDVDGDGDIDVVFMNLGENTLYRATPENPYVVFAGDIAADGGVDVIETEWDGGQLYPMRGAVELGRQMPYFGARFDSFLTFARAPVESVFGADRLSASAVRYEATTLAHTLFLNDGDGAFTGTPLPPKAQLMAAYGAVIDDLDGDTHLDIYMVGNTDTGEPTRVGPHRGGVSVWLRGDGAGSLTAVPVSESGLSVPKYARGLAAADYDSDGWIDFAVGVNDGPPMIFRNRGIEGRRGVTVSLRGPVGNPHGWGASLAISLADGRQVVREVQAGGSFMSQSSAGRVFGLGTQSGPVEVTVRWPDGTIQTQSAEPGSAIEITHPEA